MMSKTKHWMELIQLIWEHMWQQRLVESSIQNLVEQLAATLAEEVERKDEMVAMLVRCLEDVVELDLGTATLAEKRKADPIFAAARTAIAKAKGGE